MKKLKAMLLSFSEYTAVVEYVEACLASGSPISAAACCSLLSSGAGCAVSRNRSGVNVDAVQSIYLMATARRMKKLSYSFDSGGTSSKIGEIAEAAYAGSCSIWESACAMGFSPYKLAKMVLHHWQFQSGAGASLSRVQIQDVPALIAAANQAGDAYGQSAPLPLHVLDDLRRCYLYDPVSSRQVTVSRGSLGAEYEEILCDHMTRRGMVFETEADLRRRGKAKTPDAVFLIPMGVHLALPVPPHLAAEGFVVNWIDSKAMFGDLVALSEHIDQLRSYVHRYGPGLVVYWHGCLKELATYFAYAGSGSGSINSIISFGTNTSTSMNGMSSNNISNSSSGDATTTNSGVAGAASQDIHEEIARILSAADCASIRFTDGFPDRWVFPSGQEAVRRDDV